MRAMEPFGAPLLTAWTRAAAAGAVWLVVSGFAAGPGTASGGAQPVPGIGAVESRSFITSDGARLHYLEAGPRPDAASVSGGPPTVVFVPGWTMPGWIFQHQIDALKDRFHVLALDPRGQGESEVTAFGYSYERRGRDIGELIDHAAPGPVVLVGWSLGVLDSLAYVAGQGDGRIAGLVLIDNSVGEEPAPVAGPGGGSPADRADLPEDERRRRRAAFVASMFAHDPGADYRARLTDQALRMSQSDERRLLAYDVPRSYWREALHSTDKPVLYVVRPRLRAQGENLVRTHADARMEVFETAGHALFVDETGRFDALLIDFLDHRVAGTVH
jgi:non-heme chloroperoxidase